MSGSYRGAPVAPLRLGHEGQVVAIDDGQADQFPALSREPVEQGLGDVDHTRPAKKPRPSDTSLIVSMYRP